MMTERKNIAITIRSFDMNGRAFSRLAAHANIVFSNSSGERLSEKALCVAIKEADGVIAGTERFSAQVLQSAPRLKAISRVGVGLDTIDLDYAREKNIAVLNTPISPGVAVAEHTVALLLSLMKNIPQYYVRVRQGDYSLTQGSLLAGKTIGIIGLGRIGWNVALLLEAFGSRITFYDPWVKGTPPEKWVRKGTLEALLCEADIITLHSSPQGGSTPLLDGTALASCKRGSVLINTARGSLIDEPALVQALKNGVIAAAALDVVAMEPYKGPLLDYPQVVITPHVASNTVESRQQMEIEAVENILDTFEV
jgi:D-3-phosphoglycerate dehydrogenase / 2-oxoglutarate reductase